MNMRTAGVISLITFLTALVTIVWILSTIDRGIQRVVRIDAEPRQAILASPAYTEERSNQWSSTEEDYGYD